MNRDEWNRIVFVCITSRTRLLISLGLGACQMAVRCQMAARWRRGARQVAGVCQMARRAATCPRSRTAGGYVMVDGQLASSQLAIGQAGEQAGQLAGARWPPALQHSHADCSTAYTSSHLVLGGLGVLNIAASRSVAPTAWVFSECSVAPTAWELQLAVNLEGTWIVSHATRRRCRLGVVSHAIGSVSGSGSATP